MALGSIEQMVGMISGASNLWISSMSSRTLCCWPLLSLSSSRRRHTEILLHHAANPALPLAAMRPPSRVGQQSTARVGSHVPSKKPSGPGGRMSPADPVSAHTPRRASIEPARQRRTERNGSVVGQFEVDCILMKVHQCSAIQLRSSAASAARYRSATVPISRMSSRWEWLAAQ